MARQNDKVHVYVLKFDVVRGPDASSCIVHVGRTVPPLADVLREVDGRIECSEQGSRDLVSLHRRRASLLSEIEVQDLAEAEDVLQLTARYLSDLGTSVSCSLRNVFESSEEQAIACLKKAHGRKKAQKSRIASAKRQEKLNHQLVTKLKEKLEDINKQDPLPPFVCDLLDGLYGKELVSACEELLSDLPSGGADIFKCTYCREEIDLAFSAEKGWYYGAESSPESGEPMCESCSKCDDRQFLCDSCRGDYLLDEMVWDADERVCHSCLDDSD